MGRTVTSSVETVTDTPPAGQVKVAARDLRIPATDSQGRPMPDGTILVARQGRRVPTAYLEHELVAEHVLTPAEFDAAVESGKIELTALSRADRASRELDADPEAELDEDTAPDDDEDDDAGEQEEVVRRPALSRMNGDAIRAELDEHGVDYDESAAVDDLRDLLKSARESE